MFAGTFVGATYGAAAGALCGLGVGLFSIATTTNGDAIGQTVMFIVAFAIAGTLWGACLGMCIGMLIGVAVTVGPRFSIHRLPTITTLVSIATATSITALSIGAWSQQRDESGSNLQPWMVQWVAFTLTAMTSGLGGRTLGRGLLRVATDSAQTDSPPESAADQPE